MSAAFCGQATNFMSENLFSDFFPPDYQSHVWLSSLIYTTEKRKFLINFEKKLYYKLIITYFFTDLYKIAQLKIKLTGDNKTAFSFL